MFVGCAPPASTLRYSSTADLKAAVRNSTVRESFRTSSLGLPEPSPADQQRVPSTDGIRNIFFPDTDSEISDGENMRYSTLQDSKNRAYLDRPQSEYSVGWVLDDESQCCMWCDVEFSAMTWRHHCRACGLLVCNNCSRHRLPVKGLKPGYHRVCDHCFDQQKRSTSAALYRGGGRGGGGILGTGAGTSRLSPTGPFPPPPPPPAPAPPSGSSLAKASASSSSVSNAQQQRQQPPPVPAGLSSQPGKSDDAVRSKEGLVESATEVIWSAVADFVLLELITEVEVQMEMEAEDRDASSAWSRAGDGSVEGPPGASWTLRTTSSATTSTSIASEDSPVSTSGPRLSPAPAVQDQPQADSPKTPPEEYMLEGGELREARLRRAQIVASDDTLQAFFGAEYKLPDPVLTRALLKNGPMSGTGQGQGFLYSAAIQSMAASETSARRRGLTY